MNRPSLRLLIGALLLGIAGVATAHGIPGLKPLKPGEAFQVANMRGLIPDSEGHYARAGIDLNAAHDGSALAFLIADPATPSELAEAKRFEAVLKKCPNTHGFLVIPPARSMLSRQVAETMNHSGLHLSTILDEHDFFPYAFRHNLRKSPLYELFDRSQVLVIENAVHLRSKAPDGETFESLLLLLDQGKPVAPLVVSAEEQAVE
jgi:hypothetical protein